MNQARILACLCFALLLQQGSNAQLIQTFGFGGAAGNEATFPPNGQPVNGTIGSMKRGSGVTPSAAGNVFSSTGFTMGTTVDTADYFSFSIKANQGFKLNLDSIVFGQRKSNTGPASYSVRSSLDGFQNDLGSGSCPTNITYNNRISLGTAFQSVASTVTIDFRFYGYGAGAATGTWRLDSVRIHGTITLGGGGGPVIKPKAGFSPTSSSFTESAGNQNATVTITQAPSVAIRPAIYVKGGTASAGSDFTAFDTIGVAMGPGLPLSLNFPVGFLDDAVQESTETLVLVLRKRGLASDTAFDIGADSLFTFTINDNDVITPPSGPAIRTIAQIRGADSGNQADSVGKTFRVFGTIYGHNQRLSATAGGYQMFIRDASGGIGIFKNAPVSGITSLNEGDSVRVMGKIECFRGLTQINPDSMVVIATGRPIKTPVVVNNISEVFESELVRINGLQVNPATWTTSAGSGFTVKAFNGVDTFAIRIDNDCELFAQPAPTGTVDIIGMVSQFVAGNPTPTAPFPSTGYQLIPRRVSDVVVVTAVTSSFNSSRDIQVVPNPGTDFVSVESFHAGKFVVQLSDLQGRIVKEFASVGAGQKLDLTSISNGIYLFRFPETGKVLRWIKSGN
jgi:hypothetical protein